MIKKGTFFALLTLLLAGCYYDIESELYPGEFCDTPEVISYATHIEPIMLNSCAVSGCHLQGGTGPGVLDNYTQVKEFVDDGSMNQRVIVNRDMPPSGSTPLNGCDLVLIEKWIAQGAENN